MDSLTCINCGEISSVPPSARQVRCLGCQELFEIGSPSDQVWTTPTVESRGFESSSRRNRDWSLELKKKKTEAKIFFRRICSSSKYQQNQPWTPSPYSVTSDLAPRGKRALICGVSYKKQKCELKGTAQDVRNIRDLLVQVYHFPTASIRILAGKSMYISKEYRQAQHCFCISNW